MSKPSDSKGDTNVNEKGKTKQEPKETFQGLKELVAELTMKNEQLQAELEQLKGFKAPEIGDKVIVALSSWDGYVGTLVGIENGNKAVVEINHKRNGPKQYRTLLANCRKWVPPVVKVTPAPEPVVIPIDTPEEAPAAQG